MATSAHPGVDLVRLREALEASWTSATSYRGVWDGDNPALGQCYPTARVIQHFFPAFDIVRGTVWTGSVEEKHFWNTLVTADSQVAVDLTWQQFPHGSIITSSEVLDRDHLNDSPSTIQRCDLLLSAVVGQLASKPATEAR